MFAFQIFVVIFCLYAISRVFQKVKDRSLTRGWGIFWFLFWIGVGVVVALPWTTSLMAARLGVTRGVDLVIYVSVIVLFYLFFRMMLKIERIERNITRLVREEALMARQIPDSPSTSLGAGNNQNPTRIQDPTTRIQ